MTVKSLFLEKQAAMPGPGGAGQPPEMTVGAPQAGPPIPQQPMPPGQAWVGPRMSIFEQAVMPMPPDPVSMAQAAVTELTKQFPFIGKYPVEPQVKTVEGPVVLGDVYVATDTGVPVSVPWVVRDGKLRPFVLMLVGDRPVALGDEDEFITAVESPTLGHASGRSAMDSKMTLPEMAFRGPDGKTGAAARMPLDARQAMLNAIPKEAGLVEALRETGLGVKIADLLEMPASVVQFERRPFECLQKEASWVDFRPVGRKVQLHNLPQEVNDTFTQRPFHTRVLEKDAADAPLSLKPRYDEDKVMSLNIKDRVELREEIPSMSCKKGEHVTPDSPKRITRGGGVSLTDSDGTKHVFRVFRIATRLPRDTTAGSLPRKLVDQIKRGEPVPADRYDRNYLLVDKNAAYAISTDSWRTYAGKPCAPPAVTVGLSEIFKTNRGLAGYIVDKDNYAYGPVEWVSGTKLQMGGQVYHLMVSAAVKAVGVLGDKLFLPKSSRFVPTGQPVELQNLEKTASSADVVVHRMPRGMYRLDGHAVAGARWGNGPIAGSELSAADAAFVLGATGLAEGVALEKLAEADTKGAASIQGVPHVLRTAPRRPVVVELGLLKLASMVPDMEDDFLALQFMGSDTVDKFVENVDGVAEFVNNLAELTLAAQVGLGPVDENVAYKALKNMQELLRQLRELAVVQQPDVAQAPR